MIDTALQGRPVQRRARPARPRGALAKTVLAQLATREPRGVAEMVERMRDDYQVVLAESVITSNIRATPVTIAVENGGDSRAEALVESLQRLWDRSLSDMLDCFAFGRQAFEKVFEYEPKTGINTIRKLEPLPFRQTEMRLNTDGSYDGLTLKGRGESIDLSADETWWLALDPTALEPHGRSRFAGAPYRVWVSRDHAFKLRKKFVERFVIRGGTARVPTGQQDEDGEIRDPYEQMENALESLYAGGSLMLPGEKDRDGEYLWQFQEAEVRGLDPTPIDSVIDGLDVEQLRSFGIPEKTVIEGESVGSFAMVSQQMLLLLAAVEEVLAQIVESFQRYVVDKLISLNWLRNAPTITVTFPSLTKRPDSAISRLAETLLTNQQFLEAVLAGGIDVREVLEQVGLPVTDELEQRFAEALERQAESVQRATTERDDAQAPEGDQPSAVVDGQPAEDVQDTALNGAQIKSLMDIVVLATNGQIPPETARETIRAAFPSLSGEVIDAILRPLSGFTPENPAETAASTLSRRLSIGDTSTLPAVSLPSADEFADQAAEHSRQILDDLQAALEDLHAGDLSAEDRVRSLVAELKQLEVDVRVAARLIGLVLPLQPGGQANDQQSPLQLSIEGVDPQPPRGNRFRFPWTTNAVDWLLEKQVVSIEDLRSMAQQDRASVFIASGIDDLRILNDLKLEVATSLEQGESLDTFKTRIAGRIDAAEAEVNTIYRTNTKQAYIAGMESTLEKPGVKELFPFVQYVATHDTRTRPHHEVLDGIVVRRGTREHRLLQAALSDYNCRCTVIPMTEADAAFHTVSTWDTIPQEAKDYYAGAAAVPLAA